MIYMKYKFFQNYCLCLILLMTSELSPVFAQSDLAEADVAGKEGIARFEISDHASFADPVSTPWLAASSDMEKNYTKKKNPVETVNVIPV